MLYLTSSRIQIITEILGEISNVTQEIKDFQAKYKMITQNDIEKLTNTIIGVEQPDQIVLFGSYAYGEPNETSDLDVLIVKDYNVPRHKRGYDLLKALAYVRFPLDVVFYTPAEIKKWQEASLAFITTVMTKGKVLYERQHRPDVRMVQQSGT